MSKKNKKNYGWVCPKCGRVNALHVDACPCSEHKDYWNQPIYPELKIAPSVIGPFVDNPNVIGPYVDDDQLNKLTQQTAWDLLKEISYGSLPNS